MGLAAARANRAARGGDCLRTDSRLYLYSATWRRSSDRATDCKRKAARDRASSNDDCSDHQLRTGCAIQRTTEQLRTRRGRDRRLRAKGARHRWLEFAQIKERSSDRKRRSADNGSRSVCRGSGCRCGDWVGRHRCRNHIEFAVEWAECHGSAATLDARRHKGRSITK